MLPDPRCSQPPTIKSTQTRFSESGEPSKEGAIACEKELSFKTHDKSQSVVMQDEWVKNGKSWDSYIPQYSSLLRQGYYDEEFNFTPTDGFQRKPYEPSKP